VAGKTVLKKSDCRPIRERANAIRKQISEIDRDLEEPDVPADTKKRLRNERQQLKVLLRHLEAALEECEALTTLSSSR